VTTKERLEAAQLMAGQLFNEIASDRTIIEMIRDVDPGLAEQALASKKEWDEATEAFLTAPTS
jgi:hypothetical protein